MWKGGGGAADGMEEVTKVGEENGGCHGTHREIRGGGGQGDLTSKFWCQMPELTHARKAQLGARRRGDKKLEKNEK